MVARQDNFARTARVPFRGAVDDTVTESVDLHANSIWHRVAPLDRLIFGHKIPISLVAVVGETLI